MKKTLLFFVYLALCSSFLAAQRPTIDLNGTWDFQLDPQAIGEEENWHSGTVSFDESIQVPGSWQAQGFGEREGIIRHQYLGEAWYQRRVVMPADWEGKLVELQVGGAHRRTKLYVNGKEFEEHSGFSAPFSFDITDAVRPGEQNLLVLRIDNGGPTVEKDPRAQEALDPVGMLNYITSWGGIYGDVKLLATSPLRVRSVYVRPDIDSRGVRFDTQLENRYDRSLSGQLRVAVESGNSMESSFRIGANQSADLELLLSMPDAELWTPDNPALYSATFSIEVEGEEVDSMGLRFGIRKFSTQGKQLLLNGKPFYLRGYGDDNIEVLTGFPPASVETFRERLTRAKNFGFNGMRFHSMTPPPAFFEAADEVGMVIMAELPAAYTQYFLPHRDLLFAELRRTLLAHRNHPSLLTLAFGNEFNLNWLDTDEEREEFLASIERFYKAAKDLAPDNLIMSTDGFIMKPTDMASIFRGVSDEIPIMRHEFGGYYCSLPNTSLIDQFTGVIVPTWLMQKKEWVEQNGLTEEYPVYVRHSQLLLQAGRKFQIERVRKNPDVSGYHYWLIVDFPGGTGEGDSWEEGWFNYFWEPKNIEPEDGQAINSPVLTMIDAGPAERTVWSNERKRLEVTVSNYGPQAISDGRLEWKISAKGELLGSFEISDVEAPLGEVSSIGEIVIEPLENREPLKFEFETQLWAGKRNYRNSWTFWSFPREALAREASIPVHSRIRRATIHRLYPFVQSDGELSGESLLITPQLDREALQFLGSGGRVWLMAGRDQFSESGEGRFFPASGGSFGTAIGLHPALGDFPHDGYCDLQFYNLLEGSWYFSLDEWPQELKPIIGGLRTKSSFLSERKDLSKLSPLFEVQVGEGSLLVTTFRLEDILDEAYPEVIYLFDQILRYVTDEDFSPETSVSEELIADLERW